LSTRLLATLCVAALAAASPASAGPAAPAPHALDDELAPLLAQRKPAERKPAERKSARKPASSGSSRPKSNRPQANKKPAAPKGPVSIPIDVGIGPQVLVPNPPLFFDQPAYTALTISIAAVINQQLIRQHKHQIPAGYRAAAGSLNEVRIRPWWLALVPSTLILSPDVIPGVTNTGMYGALWRPIGIGTDLIREPVRFNLHADLSATYIFMHSQLREPTHFLRPGVTLSAVLEIPLGDTFLVSTGWASDFFIPQPLGRPPWELFPLEDSLWHLGGPFVKLHVRIPYEVSL
jgi:hypothetical protein